MVTVPSWCRSHIAAGTWVSRKDVPCTLSSFQREAAAAQVTFSPPLSLSRGVCLAGSGPAAVKSQLVTLNHEPVYVCMYERMNAYACTLFLSFRTISRLLSLSSCIFFSFYL
jgi:hypothetical protein